MIISLKCLIIAHSPTFWGVGTIEKSKSPRLVFRGTNGPRLDEMLTQNLGEEPLSSDVESFLMAVESSMLSWIQNMLRIYQISHIHISPSIPINIYLYRLACRWRDLFRWSDWTQEELAIVFVSTKRCVQERSTIKMWSFFFSSRYILFGHHVDQYKTWFCHFALTFLFPASPKLPQHTGIWALTEVMVTVIADPDFRRHMSALSNSKKHKTPLEQKTCPIKSLDLFQNLQYIIQYYTYGYVFFFFFYVFYIFIFGATKKLLLQRGSSVKQDIASLLWHHPFGVAEIHGDKDQRERDLALRSFTNKEKRATWKGPVV